MIRDFNDIDALASTNKPMGLVALAVDDKELIRPESICTSVEVV